MDDRARMIQLIREAMADISTFHACLIADHLIAYGAVFEQRTPIKTLHLRTRTHNALKSAGINTVEELRKLDEEQLANISGVGKNMLCEILAKRDGGTHDAEKATMSAQL